jgi:hypothetical protein
MLATMLLASAPAPAGNAVDPALMGTWKLEWPRPDLFWTVRSDGVYRMHGPGANPRQLGKLEAGQGRFSMKSLTWIDSGTYRISSPDTLVITGQLGPGTWKRVWTPGAKGSQGSPGPASCRLFTENDVAQFLGAPVAATLDTRGNAPCVYKSLLSSSDAVSVSAYPSRRQAWFNTRKAQKPTMTTVPGVGEDAYVEYAGAGALELHILNGQDQFRVRFQLTPDTSAEDVPAAIELARAAGRRLGP